MSFWAMQHLGEGIITEKVLGYIKSSGELIDQSWKTY